MRPHSSPTQSSTPTSSVDPTIVLFGFGVGFLVGLTGMGGGSLMTPLLILVFGVKPVTAIGTDIFYAAVTKTAGGWRHLKLKTVNMPLTWWLAAGSVPSAIAGVWVLDILKDTLGDELDETVFAILASCLLVVGRDHAAAQPLPRRASSPSATTSRSTRATRSPRSRSAPPPAS